jgi:hypothetical protein
LLWLPDWLVELEGVAELLVLFVSRLLDPVPMLLLALDPLWLGVVLEVELLGVVAELLLLEGVLGELSVALLDAVALVSADIAAGERVLLLELFIADPL